MTNLGARSVLVLIGLLVVMNMIWSRWINKEIKANPVPVMQPVAAQIPAGSVDEESEDLSDGRRDQSSMPDEYDIPDPAQLRRTQKRVRDKKIIYEMPTSNKILIQ